MLLFTGDFFPIKFPIEFLNETAYFLSPGSLQIFYRLNKDRAADVFTPTYRSLADGQLHWVRMHREGKDIYVQVRSFFEAKSDGSCCQDNIITVATNLQICLIMYCDDSLVCNIYGLLLMRQFIQ